MNIKEKKQIKQKKFNRQNVIIMLMTVCIFVLLASVLLEQKKKWDESKITLSKGDEVDLIMFMGQSNMSGTGESIDAPKVIEHAGYEFKAITDPTKLYKLSEPFGELENKKNGIDDGDLKTGSLVSSFVNAYYSGTQVPVVAVSASAGGSSLHSWSKEGTLLPDAVERYNTAKNWLTDNGYKIRHSYMVWLQGESDGNKGTGADEYIESLKEIVSEMQKNGIEKCFIIRIGILTDDTQLYDTIIEAQTKLCHDNEDFILISTKAVELENMGLMRDTVHYSQGGLNIIGSDAGCNMAYYVITGKEPSLYDFKDDNLYTESEE